MNAKTWIWGLAILHLLLAVSYARVTPYRTAGVVLGQNNAPAKDIGAPDERQHVNYVSDLLSNRAFPVFDPTDSNLYENYQRHQPPLYYSMAACWSRIAGIDNLESRQAGFFLRILNGLFGAAGVVGIGFLALWGTKKESTALMAAGFAALLPMNLALSGAVSNDPLLIALCSWSLALYVRLHQTGWSWKIALLAALLTGAAFLTKTTALALLPVGALGIFLTDSQTSLKTRGMRTLAFMTIAVCIALPWWIRNQSLYGDPFAIRAFNQAFTGSMQASTAIAHVGVWNYWMINVGYGTLCSFFGVFGYWDIWLPESVYNLMALTLAALSIGWLLSIRSDATVKKTHLLNGLFLLMIVILFIQFNSHYFQAQGRYLLPALGPIAVGVGSGLTFFSKKRVGSVAVFLIFVLLAINAYVINILPSAYAARTTTERTTRQ